MSDSQDSSSSEEQKKRLRESERVKELRHRLYARGDMVPTRERHPLPHDVPQAFVPTPTPPTPPTPSPEIQYTEVMASSKRNTWRKRFIFAGFLFFLIAVSTASLFMFLGNNTVSGDNISLIVSGPVTIGGGEELPFQVSIGNQNTVPIESVSLIITYPDGTHSAEDITKELTVTRQSLNTINAGEMVNVPVTVRIFGKENEEKQISVSIDYRIKGSGATLQKETTPLRFNVSTSPLVMSFDSVKSITSGQELEMTLTVQSNAPAPLLDVLVKMTYPNGFDITSTNLETISGEDTWKIKTLKPGEKKVITVTGLITGTENEKRNFEATAGVAGSGDATTLVSILAKADTEVSIEKSFFDVAVSVNKESSDTVIVSPGDSITVEVQHKNILDTTMYNGEVLIELSGNALNELGVTASDGFYDSIANTVVFNQNTTEVLREILPGEKNTLTFTIEPDNDIVTSPQIALTVTVKGTRLLNERGKEEIVGVAERIIKVESIQKLSAFVQHKDGPFTNTGPVPPIAEEVTQYTFSFIVESGVNDVTGAEVVAVLPMYVQWLDLVTDGETVTYNPSTRTIRWVVGDMDAYTNRKVSMQVALLPSLAQINTIPTLLDVQRFKATDRFTGTVVRAEHAALTTNIPDEPSSKDGKVGLQ